MGPVAAALRTLLIRLVERLDEAVLEPLSDDYLAQGGDRDQANTDNQIRSTILVNTAKPAEPRKNPKKNP